MMINLVARSKDLINSGNQLFGTEELLLFLSNQFSLADLQNDRGLLQKFMELDDLDIWGAIKMWKNEKDYVIRNISNMFLTRNLFKINLRNEAFSEEELDSERLRSLKNSKYKKKTTIISSLTGL
jgi:uncharacterized protein